MTKVIIYGTYDLLNQGHFDHLPPIYGIPMAYAPITALMPIAESRKSNTEMRHKN